MADDKQRPDEGAAGEDPRMGPIAVGTEGAESTDESGAGSRSDAAVESNAAPVEQTATDAPDRAADIDRTLVPEQGETVAAPPRRRTPWAALFLSGLLGGSVVAASAAYLWSAYMEDEGVMSVLWARLGAVELAVRDLNTRGSQAQGDAATMEGLAARLAKLEATVAASPGSRGSGATTQPAENPLVAPDPALAERVVGLETLMKSLAETVSGVQRRADETASAIQEVRTRAETASQGAAPAGADAVVKVEFDALAARVTSMQQAAASLQQSIDRTTASVEQATARGAETAAADRAVRLAVIVSALRSAVDRGLPFAGELKAAKALMTDQQALAPLDPFAASGVPTAETLGRELAALGPELAQSGDTQARDGGYLERLQSHVERLVRVRPVNGAAAGDDVAAVVARIEAKAKQGDIAGALTELRKLPESVRARAAAWVKKAEARQAAIAAAQRVEDSALAALANP